MGQQAASGMSSSATPSSGAPSFSGFGGVNGQSMMNQQQYAPQWGGYNPAGRASSFMSAYSPYASMQSHPSSMFGLGSLPEAQPGLNRPMDWGGERLFMTNPAQRLQSLDRLNQEWQMPPEVARRFEQDYQDADAAVMPWERPYYS
jgi:hypothetical protein